MGDLGSISHVSLCIPHGGRQIMIFEILIFINCPAHREIRMTGEEFYPVLLLSQINSHKNNNKKIEKVMIKEY